MTTTTRSAPATTRRIADWRRSPAVLFFLLPCIVIFGVFLAYPLIRNVYVGLYDWNGLSSVTKFIGLDNFIWVFTSPAVLGTAWNTLVFGVVTVSLQLGGGFLLAVGLSGHGRLRQVLRTIFFIPVVLTPVVVGYLYSKILEPNDGDLRNLLDTLGIGFLNHPWLADPRTALFAVAIVNVWLWVGFSMSVYQSALTTLPPELIEAARIDGARSWQVVRHVVLPYLRPTHWALLTLSVIGTLKTFDIVYVLTKGGPSGSTELPTTLLFKVGFDEYRQGRAAALGTVLFVVALVLTIIQLRLGRDREAKS